MQAIARDEQAKRRAGTAPHRKETRHENGGGAPGTTGANAGGYPTSSAPGDVMEDFNASDEEDLSLIHI